MSDMRESTTQMKELTQQSDEKNVVKDKRKSRKLPKSVRPEEFKALIQVTPDKDKSARISFLLAYASGMRISEVLRCSPEHFRPNSLFVPESKYGLERVVPIPKGWKNEFIKYLPLTNSKAKNPIDTGSRKLERKFKKYAAKANLNPLYTFHSLRHGFATRLLESGAPINQVQVLLGHSNLATTSIYTKANPMDALKNYEDLF